LKNIQWCVHPSPKERRFISLLCRCNATNDAFQDFYLLPNVDRKEIEFRLKENGPWLNTGLRLTHLSELLPAVRSLGLVVNGNNLCNRGLRDRLFLAPSDCPGEEMAACG
jgi:hypothetical protein